MQPHWIAKSRRRVAAIWHVRCMSEEPRGNQQEITPKHLCYLAPILATAFALLYLLDAFTANWNPGVAAIAYGTWAAIFTIAIRTALRRTRPTNDA